MLRRLLVCTLLVATVFLSACASSSYLGVKIVRPDKGQAISREEQVAPASVEKVVTLLPQGELITPTPSSSRATEKNPWGTAADNVRELLGAPELELTYQGQDHSPNATNAPAVLFVDSQGNRYYISQDSLQPIEFTLEKPIQETPGSPKTLAELRALAEQIAKTHSTRFVTVKDRLTFYEANKSGENYFFRWEMAGSDVGGMPAIFQVGLKQDGTLFGYLNSLDLLP